MFVSVIKMLHSIKKISIENRPDYFFSDIINIKSFDPNLLEIHKLSCISANISIYHIIEYIQMKSLDHVNIILFTLLKKVKKRKF